MEGGERGHPAVFYFVNCSVSFSSLKQTLCYMYSFLSLIQWRHILIHPCIKNQISQRVWSWCFRTQLPALFSTAFSFSRPPGSLIPLAGRTLMVPLGPASNAFFLLSLLILTHTCSGLGPWDSNSRILFPKTIWSGLTQFINRDWKNKGRMPSLPTQGCPFNLVASSNAMGQTTLTSISDG